MTTTIGRLAMLVALACAAPTQAQLVSSLTGPAGSAEIAAAIAAATPPECPAPMADALVATAGTAPNCMTRPDARRATQVQPVATVTLADGTFTASWPATWPGGPPMTIVAVARSTTTPYICQVGAATADTVTGRCFELFATTLGATLTAVVGTVISPFRNAAAGVPVNIVGRQ